MIPNSEAKQVIIEFLGFKNANFLCKRINRLLRDRSAPLEKWIRDTINTESHDKDDTHG